MRAESILSGETFAICRLNAVHDRLSIRKHLESVVKFAVQKSVCRRFSRIFETFSVTLILGDCAGQVTLRTTCSVFSARCNIYISRLCQCLSVSPSVCDGSALWSRCMPRRGEGSSCAMLAIARPSRSLMSWQRTTYGRIHRSRLSPKFGHKLAAVVVRNGEKNSYDQYSHHSVAR